MPGRPSKPTELIVLEGKSHRTKAELKVRAEAEKSLLTGHSLKPWPEVKDNKLAIKEFKRVKKLLAKIGHDDALYEAVINRYCLLAVECKQVDKTIEQLRADIEELREMKNSGQLDPMTYLDKRQSLQSMIMGWDKKLMDKRKMLLQIEKENIMTILGAMRSIPKKAPEKKESPMAEHLRRKREAQSG